MIEWTNNGKQEQKINQEIVIWDTYADPYPTYTINLFTKHGHTSRE